MRPRYDALSRQSMGPLMNARTTLPECRVFLVVPCALGVRATSQWVMSATWRSRCAFRTASSFRRRRTLAPCVRLWRRPMLMDGWSRWTARWKTCGIMMSMTSCRARRECAPFGWMGPPQEVQERRRTRKPPAAGYRLRRVVRASGVPAYSISPGASQDLDTIQFDVTSAYLHGVLKEVFVEQPDLVGCLTPKIICRWSVGYFST